MSLIQFLRILWARRIFSIVCVVFTALGGIIVTLVVTPRYEATSRILMSGLLKADPVTGKEDDRLNLGPYIDTQIEMIKDYTVAAQVADQLGWTTDPRKIAAYQSRPRSDQRDFRHWLAQQVADHTSAGLTSGTVFEIRFNSPSAQEARLGAEALRQTYMTYTLSARRQDASRNAEWYLGQADAARKLAETAELTRAAFERDSGIVMQGEGSGGQQDIDSARLSALVGQSAMVPATVAAQASVSSEAKLQLAQIDAELSENSAKLGPNHPAMQQLRARRALVASVVAQEKSQPGQSAGTNLAAVAQALAAQKGRVLGQRDKVERLRQLQAEVDLRREQYKKTAARAAELELEAGIADNGMSSIGVVVTPDKPAFPNKKLMVMGAIGLGAGLGLALSLLVEFLNRRVRGIEDLDSDPGLNCLGIVSSAQPKRWLAGRFAARSNPLIAEAAAR
jgi:succinoglycan biosynthesis transport protein ExoP